MIKNLHNYITKNIINYNRYLFSMPMQFGGKKWHFGHEFWQVGQLPLEQT